MTHLPHFAFWAYKNFAQMMCAAIFISLLSPNLMQKIEKVVRQSQENGITEAHIKINS